MSWPSQNIWTLPSKYFLKIIVAFHNWRQKNTGRVNRKYGLLKINLLYKVSCHSFYGFVHLSYLVPFFYFSQKTSASLALINCRFLWDIGLTFKSKLRKYAFLNNFLSYILCIWTTWLINTCLFFFRLCRLETRYNQYEPSLRDDWCFSLWFFNDLIAQPRFIWQQPQKCAVLFGALAQIEKSWFVWQPLALRLWLELSAKNPSHFKPKKQQ